MLWKILLSLLIYGSCVHATYHDFLKDVEGLVAIEHRPVLPLLYHDFLDNLSPVEHPTLIALGGSPGSGKTTFSKRLLPAKNTHLHNMDEVLLRLPGYQDDVISLGARKAFEKWWRVARELSEVLVHYAIQSNYNIIYDRTCGAEGSYEDFLDAKKRGYKIHLIGLFVDREIAQQRALKREAEGGPAISQALLTEYSSRFSALWPYYLKLVDQVTLYQNNSEKPLLIFSSDQGILEEEIYTAFLKEGESFHHYFAQRLLK